MGIAITMLGRRELAEEVLQDAYLAVWQKAGPFKSDNGCPLGWLTTIVRHRAINRLRSMGASAAGYWAVRLKEPACVRRENQQMHVPWVPGVGYLQTPR